MRKLCECTWLEVQEYLHRNNELIVPIGTCEQHSKHLPLNTDTLLAEYFCGFLSKEKDILIAPTINYGVNLPCDKVFSGTTSVTKSVLKKYFILLTKWWTYQGFSKFLVISAHGDPFHIQAFSNLNHLNVHFLELLDLNMKEELEKQECFKHACEGETSIMQFLFPETVRTGKIEDFVTPMNEFLPYLHHKKLSAIKNSPGGQGYPSFASRRKGQRITKLVKQRVLTWYREIKNHDTYQS